jgi:hypothetical protein
MCMTVNLPFVLYGCETWSVTLSEEQRVRVLRKTLGGERVGNNRQLEKIA